MNVFPGGIINNIPKKRGVDYGGMDTRRPRQHVTPERHSPVGDESQSKPLMVNLSRLVPFRPQRTARGWQRLEFNYFKKRHIFGIGARSPRTSPVITHCTTNTGASHRRGSTPTTSPTDFGHPQSCRSVGCFVRRKKFGCPKLAAGCHT
jgi:hypothetical protein